MAERNATREGAHAAEKPRLHVNLLTSTSHAADDKHREHADEPISGEHVLALDVKSDALPGMGSIGSAGDDVEPTVGEAAGQKEPIDGQKELEQVQYPTRCRTASG